VHVEARKGGGDRSRWLKVIVEMNAPLRNRLLEYGNKSTYIPQGGGSEVIVRA
jgi:hypothetical protein